MSSTIKQRIDDIQRGNIPAGYRKTKLGIIPADWSTPELNSVLTENKERNRSGRFGKEDVLSVSGEFGVTNQIELLGRSFAGASVKDYHVVEAGNIVYTKSPLKDNPYGIIKLNKGNAGIVSTLYAVYSCKSNEVGTYLDYYFSLDQNVNNYLRPLVRKGTKNDMKINNEDVLKGCVILPPESEIAKIVEILGCCDRMIALKKELIAEKKKQKKALMQKLLNPDSGFRLPGFSGEWKSGMLREFITLVSGVDFTADKLLTDNKLTPYLTGASNIKEHKLILNRWVMKPCNIALQGDILVVCKGSGVGTLAIMNIPQAHIARQFMAIRPNKNIASKYVFYILQDSFEKIKNCSQGLIAGVDRPTILNMFVTLPSQSEQQVIADILSAADKEIDLLEQELSQQEQKKKSLMQLLLTGIVRV